MCSKTIPECWQLVINYSVMDKYATIMQHIILTYIHILQCMLSVPLVGEFQQ